MLWVYPGCCRLSDGGAVLADIVVFLSDQSRLAADGSLDVWNRLRGHVASDSLVMVYSTVAGGQVLVAGVPARFLSRIVPAVSGGQSSDLGRLVRAQIEDARVQLEGSGVLAPTVDLYLDFTGPAPVSLIRDLSGIPNIQIINATTNMLMTPSTEYVNRNTVGISQPVQQQFDPRFVPTINAYSERGYRILSNLGNAVVLERPATLGWRRTYRTTLTISQWGEIVEVGDTLAVFERVRLKVRRVLCLGLGIPLAILGGIWVLFGLAMASVPSDPSDPSYLAPGLIFAIMLAISAIPIVPAYLLLRSAQQAQKKLSRRDEYR